MLKLCFFPRSMVSAVLDEMHKVNMPVSVLFSVAFEVCGILFSLIGVYASGRLGKAIGSLGISEPGVIYYTLPSGLELSVAFVFLLPNSGHSEDCFAVVLLALPF